MRRQPGTATRAWALASASAFALLACTGTPPKTPPKAVQVPAAQAKPEPVAEAPELPDVLRALPADADNYLLLDGRQLRHSAVYQALGEALGSLDADPFAEAKQKCHFDPSRQIERAALAARLHDSGGVVAVIRFSSGPGRALDCLKTLGAQPGPSGGLEPRPGILVETAGPLLVAGDPSAVRLAVGRVQSRARGELSQSFDKALKRFPDALLVGSFSSSSLVPESGFGDAVLAITARPEHFELRAEAETSEPQVAQSYVQAFESSGMLTGTRALLPKIDLSVEGNRMIFVLAVDGSPTEQATKIGAATALAVNGVRRYIARSKEAEAKNAVHTAARDLASYIERLQLAGTPAKKLRFPASAPRTPKDVPRGVATPVTAADWQHPTWRALGFVIEEPVRYSYEIRTAKDGKSAVVMASGDLDGDGVQSHISQTVTLDAHGNVAISDDYTIDNELE